MAVYSKKIILLGKFGAGKTSLIRQFVHRQFSDQYLTTIGVRIDKKIIHAGENQISLLIWDIAGETEMQKVPSSYKLGSQGVIYVYDLTRPFTYEDIQSELAVLKTLLPEAPVVVAGNKKDLIEEAHLMHLQKELWVDCFFCSAKTGEHVEDLFEALVQKMKL